jgi:2-amino-4-hydroxy-6-hydroxymethyldihydropteridine diphosphokinase
MLRVKKEKEVKSIMEKEKINNTKDLYVGIGSNLNNPINQVKKAIQAISLLDKFNNTKISNFYESAPMGPSNQDNYINCVVMFKCGESPEDILLLLKDIESSMGRNKTSVRWSERIIDLDIIMYGDLIYQSENLLIPHINIYQRAFVLLPLIDINPEAYIPKQGYAKDLIKDCLYNDIRKIKEK